MNDPLPGYRAPDDPHDPQTWHYAESPQREPESSKGHYAVGAIIFWLVVALVAVLWGKGAFAQQQQCGPRERVIADLTGEQFNEVQRNVGLVGEVGLAELYTNETTGTWTLLLSKPDGSACLVMSGSDWGGPLVKPGKPL